MVFWKSNNSDLLFDVLPELNVRQLSQSNPAALFTFVEDHSNETV